MTSYNRLTIQMVIQRVVILGGHIQALGLARQIAHIGVEVVLLCDSSYSVARYSNMVSRSFCYSSPKEEEQYINQLCLPNRATLLFPTNDEGVEFLCQKYEEYRSRFVLGIPQPEVVALFLDKRKAYKYVIENKIPCPSCWYPNSMTDVEVLSRELPYPVVIKPAVMYSFHALFRKKAYRCDNAEELLNACSFIESKHYPISSILIQEFLEGGAVNLYSYGATAINGKPIISIQANRIRQNPMDFGNSTTFAVTCDIDKIRVQSEYLLNIVHYDGLAEIEWMYDDKSGQYKFLEINTRAWKWHTISNQLGFSFIGSLIAYYNGEKPIYSQVFKKVGWVEHLTDLVVIFKSILFNKTSPARIIRSYHIKKESAVWRWNDPLPSIMYVLMSPILFRKRY